MILYVVMSDLSSRNTVHFLRSMFSDVRHPNVNILQDVVYFGSGVTSLFLSLTETPPFLVSCKETTFIRCKTPLTFNVSTDVNRFPENPDNHFLFVVTFLVFILI